MKFTACVVAALLMCGCEELGFTPYDYEKSEDARVKVKPFGCDVRIQGKKLRLEKKMKIPVQPVRVRRKEGAPEPEPYPPEP